MLLDADKGFISCYSFPDGHPSDGNLPRIDTLFIDFDFDDGDYEPGSGNRETWRRDLSHLLVRVRRVARFLHDNGRNGWRAALSGHKGVHLFLDFDAVNADGISNQQAKNGLNTYGEELVQQLADATGMDDLAEYVDVTSSDLSRLCRVPNTKHTFASESFGEDRYCVPISIAELAEITPSKYESLTRERQAVPWGSREPNAEVGEIVQQAIDVASDADTSLSRRGTSTIDYDLVDDYKDASNDAISLDDIPMLTSDRPCLWEFYKRDDKYRHGFQSHYAEMWAIRELQERNVPIDVMKQFFDSAPEYNEAYTEERIKKIIARDYHRFSLEAFAKNAPEFVADTCGIHHDIL